MTRKETDKDGRSTLLAVARNLNLSPSDLEVESAKLGIATATRTSGREIAERMTGSPYGAKPATPKQVRALESQAKPAATFTPGISPGLDLVGWMKRMSAAAPVSADDADDDSPSALYRDVEEAMRLCGAQKRKIVVKADEEDVAPHEDDGRSHSDDDEEETPEEREERKERRKLAPKDSPGRRKENRKDKRPAKKTRKKSAPPSHPARKSDATARQLHFANMARARNQYWANQRAIAAQSGQPMVSPTQRWLDMHKGIVAIRPVA